MPTKLSDKYRVPEKLADKSLQEQVKRCVTRISSFPRTVETLLKTVSSLQKDPDNSSYRMIDCCSAGYRKVIANIPGAEDFLRAMKFIKTGKYFVMERNVLDLSLLEMGIKALGKSKNSLPYRKARRMMQFNSDVQRICAGGVGLSHKVSERTSRSINYMNKAPPEPVIGQGTLIQFKMAGTTLMRRFNGDDQLQDIISWIGCLYGSAIPDKILAREWCVVDLNRCPAAPVSFHNHNMEKTLQYIGFWPSGKLELRPSDDNWRLGREMLTISGSARGLGSAIDVC